LIRDSRSTFPRPIGPKQLRKIVHNLFLRAGILGTKKGRMYDLRVHTIRKFFKTWLVHRGLPESYADFMIGHVTDTYHDIQSLGVERLRAAYASAGLTLRPAANDSKEDMVKEFARGLGLNPEAIMFRNTVLEPDTKYLDPEQRQRWTIRVLMEAIREELTKPASPSEYSNGTSGEAGPVGLEPKGTGVLAT